MEINPKFYLIISCVSYLYMSCSSQQATCNPFNPMFAYPPVFRPPTTLQGPMMMNPQFDPFLALQNQYVMAQPMNMWPYDASRRSYPGMFGRINENRANTNDRQQNEPETDEQKALDGLPASLIEETPSTLTERLSESFSALNEGVKNHFRSLSENFSDTLDDIKDVWKSPEKEGSKKRES